MHSGEAPVGAKMSQAPPPPFIDLPPNPEFLTWNKTQVDFRKETTLAVEEKILDRTVATCGE